MRLTMTVLAFSVLFLAGAQANAASCASYATFKTYDDASKSVTLKFKNGRTNKFFPKPEGATGTRIPSPCKGKVTKEESFQVKATGGRMTMTQVRSNFTNKMQNDPDDASWLGGKLQELIDAKTQVVVEIRQGMAKDSAYSVTTVYLPANEADFAEIKRLEDQAVDE